jgi:putative transposase
MERAFDRYGLPDAIRSDNGAPFASSHSLLGLSRLSVWWLALGISLERGRPGCPQDNGGHERMHLDISRQLERTDYQERQPALDLWRTEFNEERPHEALGMRFPAEVYEPSKRRYLCTPEVLEYPGMETRKVNSGGMVKFDGMNYFLSNALTGWNVAIIPAQNGLYKVAFAGLSLGHLEPSTQAFLPALPSGKAGEEPPAGEQSAA